MTRPSRRALLQGAAVGASLAAFGGAHAAGPKKGDLYVIAEIVSKPDTADALRALLVPFAAKSRKEPGCHEYTLMEDEKQPGRFLTYERWTGHPALDAHRSARSQARAGAGQALHADLPERTQDGLTRDAAARAAMPRLSARIQRARASA